MEKNKAAKDSGALSSLPNIGPVTQRQLEKAGIFTPEGLRAVGSREAFLRLRLREPDACLNVLYALEGAVQNIRDTQLSPETKGQLKAFFKTL